MARLVLVLWGLIFACVASAQDAPRPLATAMDALRDGDWAVARAAARGDGRVAVDVVMWHALRAKRGTPEDVLDFLDRNGDWPGLPYLRKQSEGTMAKGSPAQIRAFYSGEAPQTGTGALSLARVQWDAGEKQAAMKTATEAWLSLALTGEEHAGFMADWPKTLAKHHQARMDMLLWKGWTKNATLMLPLVSADWQKLAEARIGLRRRVDGVDGLIAAVPENLAKNPGLAFERFLWRARKGRNAGAVEILLERSGSAASLGAPEYWADRRLDLARRWMRSGRHSEAYRIAARHGLTEGSDFAALEWQAGFIALRLLGRPGDAVDHFKRFLGAVETPISKGRGGYWLGRAYEALDNKTEAQKAYALGGRYQTSFYGLLAAERGGIPFDDRLMGNESFPSWRDATFTESSVFEAALLLLAADELSLGERFLTHLAESLDRTQIGQMGDMLAEMEQPHIQVMLGKRAADYGMQVHAPYYALHPLARRDLGVPEELALAIARRESEFDPNVVSGAGARGLMQLMPGTAKEVSRKLGLDYTRAALTQNPTYNVTLGSAYLAQLIERFRGNPVLVAAAYNAGPSRPERWIRTYGDPLGPSRDMIDWIEFIPFDETRNYVMRVTESLPIYRARLGKDPLPTRFRRELVSSSLLPGAP